MTFFKKSDGSAVVQSTSAETGGFQKLIPDGTQLQCNIAGAVWAPATQNASDHIVITLHVVEPGTYRNFTVDHKIHVLDASDKKRDKALDMLMTYDTLCKGELAKADAAGKNLLGDNGLLARALNGGTLIATFAEWEMENNKTGEMMRGNWVRAICAKPGAKEEAKAAEVKAEVVGAADTNADYDDDTPF